MQITYEGLFQAKLDEYPLDADDIARTYTGISSQYMWVWKFT